MNDLRPCDAVLLGRAAALALALAGCTREPETALRIGTNVWIGSEPLYLARELGSLDPAPVQLVEYPSASEVLRAFRNQAIDGMVISLDELFGLAVDGCSRGSSWWSTSRTAPTSSSAARA